MSCPLELELAVGGYKRFPRSPMSKVSFCQKQQECKECKERLMNLFLVNFLLWNNPSLDFMLFAQILKNHNPPFLSFNGSNLKVLWRTEGYLTPTGAWLFWNVALQRLGWKRILFLLYCNFFYLYLCICICIWREPGGGNAEPWLEKSSCK